ncbi:MAG: Asp-tRNA(Asn)/Glu-tRNA(Gln) amidotransferase subunit GatA, partial [Peptococcaceae bacterium]|nr:Asp-tRNA(Asn)/Glu-tRNA(Gln) amidotransferase subunit GatA [Peptococcaceae bacterium]
KKDFDQALAKYDVLISPTTPTIAYKAGEKSDLLSMYLGDAYTIPINLAGLPAITIPAGFVAGMPVGMQIIAKHFAEGLLYRVAYTYEQNTAYHREIPAFLKEGE